MKAWSKRWWPTAVALVVLAGSLPGGRSQDEPKPSADLIKPGDRLDINVPTSLPGMPVRGMYTVEASGKVALGYEYGRIKVAGMSLEQAEQAVRAKLAALIRDPAISLKRWQDPTPVGFRLEAGKQYEIFLPNQKAWPSEQSPVTVRQHFANDWVEVTTVKGKPAWINLRHAMQIDPFQVETKPK